MISHSRATGDVRFSSGSVAGGPRGPRGGGPSIGILGGLGILGILFWVAGCETTELATYESDSGAFQAARAFLRVGRTTMDQVRSKYGKPGKVWHQRGYTLWQYRKREEVLVTAYSGTALGTESAFLDGQPGFRHTVLRTRELDLWFDPAGVLRAYRVYRDVPPARGGASNGAR